MAKQAVNAVKEAELKVMQQEEQCDKECRDLIQQARDEARVHGVACTKQAKCDQEEALVQAQKQAQEEVSKVLEKVAQAKQQLGAQAKFKEQKAIDLILSEII